MARIEAPAPEDGKIIGVGGIVFTDGVAQTDDIAVITYCREHGYTVDGAVTEADEGEVIDSRDVGPALVGTPARDAAVDPRPQDYLPPIGAGTADPHGPDVVSPGLHDAEDQAVIRPGKVRSAPSPQERDELAQARRTPRS